MEQRPDGTDPDGDPGDTGDPSDAGEPSSAAGDTGEVGSADAVPPPTPFEQPQGPPVLPPTVPAPDGGPGGVEGRRRRRRGRGRRVLVGLLAVLLVGGAAFTGGLAAADRIDVPDVLRGRAAVEAEDDAALVALLEDIVRTEAVMLAFNDTVADRLADTDDEAAALAVVENAASYGAGGLAVLRPGLVDRTGGRADTVRDAYLPHLDAWIDYLRALSVRPELLFLDDAQQPYLLLINATAEEFADALEALLARDPSPRAATLAERILDDGFRSEGPDPTL